MYKKIQSGSVAKSYLRKWFLIYEEIRKYFPIYEEAYITLQLLHSDFSIHCSDIPNIEYPGTVPTLRQI
jgi:hypothetical protein